jgi:hypothetical protein
LFLEEKIPVGIIFQSKFVYLPLATVAGLMAISAAQADVVNLTPSSDAMIFGTSAGADTGNASGQGPGLFAGADGSGNIKRSMLEFNFSSIPSNATITSVTLTLYLGQIAGSSGGTQTVTNALDRQFGLYDILQPCTEGTSGSPTSSNIGGSGQGYTRVNGDVTWDYANYNSNSALASVWGTVASPIHGGNFSSTESDLLDVPIGYLLANDAPFSWSSAGMASDVQAWINGTQENDGWLLKSDNLEGMKQSFLGFWSKDGAVAVGDMDLTPTLTVTFTVPEPASLLVILAAVPMVLRRRHRGVPASVT